MENQEYLDQISAQNVPRKKGNQGAGKFLSSKMMIFIGVGVGLFILLAIIGGALSSGKGGMQKNLTQLKLHLDSVVNVINSYQPNVKSSNLRSSSASLKNVLSNTSVKLDGYMTEKYGKDSNKAAKNLTEQAKTEEDALLAELFDAKINGILDRIYAHKMAYEISKITSEEGRVYNSASDDTLKEIVGESYNSLENLYNEFNDFSETK